MGESSGVSVRGARRGDLPALQALYDEIHAIHVAALPWMFRMPEGHARDAASIAALLSDKTVGVFVAEAEGTVAGLVEVRLRVARDRADIRPRRFGMVDTLVVGKSQQRRGIGRALMAQAEGWAAARGATELQLGVWAFNEGAVRFYEALGYETVMMRMRRALTEGR